ncbi:MAG: hypothetical protein E7480_00335 [Ruminococcaceae bacterium]|nr:hypothetical protein [Oscillospiraceae bacterium]
MKKVLASCLIIVMLVSMCVSVFAAPNGFVSSPSGNDAPIVVEFNPADEDCTARLVITPYADRHELTGALLAMFEKAYNSIVNSEDISLLNNDLLKLITDKKINGKNLAVSDLFDIHVTGCDYHDEHMDFDVILDADTLSHFVALLHMNKNSEWELVKDAKVVNNGEHLQFSVDSFSPFAVVVDTSAGGQVSPPTGSNSNIYICAVVMAVCALALVFVFVINKKKA